MLLQVNAQTEDLSLFTQKEKSTGDVNIMVWVSVYLSDGTPVSGLTKENFHLYPFDGWQTLTIKSCFDAAADGPVGAGGFYGLQLHRAIGTDSTLATVARFTGLVVFLAKDKVPHRGSAIVKLSYLPQ